MNYNNQYNRRNTFYQESSRATNQRSGFQNKIYGQGALKANYRTEQQFNSSNWRHQRKRLQNQGLVLPKSKNKQKGPKNLEGINSKPQNNKQSEKHNNTVDKEKQAQGTFMMVVTSQYPVKVMSEEQLGDLQTAILDAIDKIEVGAFRPQFLECFRKKGALVLDCNNQESIDWLKNSVQSLTPWEGAQFRVIQPGKTVVQKVIVHNEYPLKVLSSEQIDNLQSDLVKVVEELPSNDFVPLFLNCVRQRGTLLVDCNDQESADWLRSSVPDVLVAWDGPELIIADPEKIPYRKYLQLCIPDPGEEPERILSRLQRQNKGINSKDWHFVRKKKEKNSTSLFVAVDDEVSKALKAVGFKLFLNFGRIMVKDLGKFRPILERKPKKSDDSIKQTEDKNVSKMDLSSEDLTEILTEVDELLTEVENQETKE